MTDIEILSNRISELEIENAYQRETIETLNDSVTKQWAEIDRLGQLLEKVMEHLRTPPDGTLPGTESPPPHY